MGQRYPTESGTMITIDFIAGAHGNYLEFVLNKLVMGDTLPGETPFNQLGASHNKVRIDDQLFRCGHYFEYGIYYSNDIISIRFTGDDLLPLMTLSLLRAGDMDIDDKNLHIDTFNKLNNVSYLSTLNNLKNSFCNVIVNSYSNVKASDWPNISNPEEFYSLPNHIQLECQKDFGFRVYPLTHNYPDCGRDILREFFKFGFKDPSTNGFMQKQIRMKYIPNQNVFNFSYNSFYDFDLFKIELDRIKDFFDLTYTDFDIETLHKQFLKRQPQRNYKLQCDDIIMAVNNKISTPIPQLSLFQESYINAQLELFYNKEMPSNKIEYFTNTQEILEYLNEV